VSIVNSVIDLDGGAQLFFGRRFNVANAAGGGGLAARGGDLNGVATSTSTLPAMATASINGGVTQTNIPTVQPTSMVQRAVKY
jgi:hypothetical protein